MDLKNKKFSATYGNLLTINTVAGSPTSGDVQNGDGTNIASMNINGDLSATNVNANLASATTVNAQNTNTTNITATDVNATNINATTFVATVATGDAGGLTNINAQNITGVYTGNIALPWAKLEWTTNYFNLPNNALSRPRWDVYDDNTTLFEVFDLGGFNPRLKVNQNGLYLFLSTVHLYDMYADMDLQVHLIGGSSNTASNAIVTCLNDEKFAESQEDRTIQGQASVEAVSGQYYTIGIEPSANSPFPSSANNCPTSLTVIKVA